MTTPVRARKKPVEIEAMRFDGTATSAEAIKAWAGDVVTYTLYGSGEATDLIVGTLEGDMFVSVGDYVIKGVKGEFYPCKPDIFVATYDLLGRTDEAQ